MSYLGLAPNEGEQRTYLDAYIEFFKKLSTAEFKSEDDLKQAAYAGLLKELYENLDTLDSKASALLTFCGLIIASSSLFLTWKPLIQYEYLVYLILVAAGISALLAMRVIFVEWTSADRLSRRSLGEACKSYYKERQGRTVFYRMAWSIMFAATLLFLVFVLTDVLLPRAS